MKFLVVDDSATMRRILVNSLERIGFTDVVEAGGGREALDRFDASVGFVIAEWNMPGLGGLELARRLRARPAGRAAPILVVTTGSVGEDILAAVGAGVSDGIVKPFTPAVLRAKIDRLVGAGAAG
jgi:two-component system chemotaxis response regulator CheY